MGSRGVRKGDEHPAYTPRGVLNDLHLLLLYLITLAVTLKKKKNKKVSHGQQGPLRERSSPYGTLSQRGLLDPIKLAYDQRRPDGRLKLTTSAFNQVGRPAFLVTGPTVTQNSLFLPW